MLASVATISISAGTQGLALTLSTGTTTIAISYTSVSASATMTVGAAALVSIAIAPAKPIIPLGTTRQFTAAGTYSHSGIQIQDVTSTATWSSSSPSIAVISNAAGTAGLADPKRLMSEKAWAKRAGFGLSPMTPPMLG